MRHPGRALIIGAGPAGLTAALEFLRHSDIRPIVVEASPYLGGLSRTVVSNGNRIDIGGHRFFSKSDRVMNWWGEILPLQASPITKTFNLRYRGGHSTMSGQDGPDPDSHDLVMLVRKRQSRIYFDGKFFNYPIRLEPSTIRNLGPLRVARMGVSYTYARIRPRPERTLEDFYINRFGRVLYNTFFRDYTTKVWGVAPKDIAPEWGAQRVKGLSVRAALAHAIKNHFRTGNDAPEAAETSLIEHFLYPKYGPGQLWERVGELVTLHGGTILTNVEVTQLVVKDNHVVSAHVRDNRTGERYEIPAEFFLSTMPVKSLIAALDGIDVPIHVSEIANGLPYRDFITVGILTTDLEVHDKSGELISDTWIYIQEPDVQVGRLQIFNNWSPYLVADPSTVWVGMEYFCNEDDVFWRMPDADMSTFAISELAKIGLLDPNKVLETTVIRTPKAYPGYTGTYTEFEKIRRFTDEIVNLFLIGRNGQHRYNNQDHSMLTAIEAVSNIVTGRTDKANVWGINVEQEYHESR